MGGGAPLGPGGGLLLVEVLVPEPPGGLAVAGLLLAEDGELHPRLPGSREDGKGSGGIHPMHLEGLVHGAPHRGDRGKVEDAVHAPAQVDKGVPVEDVASDELHPVPVKEVLDRWGAIDILVNNAGITQRIPITEMPLEVLEEELKSLLKSSIRHGRSAKDVMTTPVITVSWDDTVKQAESITENILDHAGLTIFLYRSTLSHLRRLSTK
jgi:NAD(P)-dependent dehydrogenase (short-subunit alcohol dehydrogenase family)